jgi:iron transport multicopper oxidase
MGLQAATASSMLHEQGNPLGSWSIAIPKMTEDEALSALNIYDAGGHLSLRHRCFVSAVGLKSVTISGSPPALNRFAASLTASQPSRKIIWLPIYAGYHASHIHTVLDFSSFLSRCGVDAELLSSFKTLKTLLSPLTGQPVDSPNALGLFKIVVHHTLQAPLRLDLILDRCERLIQDNAISTVRIDTVGPNPVGESLAATLRGFTDATISVHDLVVLDPGADEYRPSASFSHAPLAIVGMSGRFPGADSAEGLWRVLEQGLDLHRVVSDHPNYARAVTFESLLTSLRFPKTGSTLRATLIPQERPKTPVGPPTAASSTGPGSSILGSSTCRRGRPFRQTRCSGSRS